NRPNIVNNSWGGGGGDTWYQAKVVAWRAAGIFPAFSAGNSGSGCSTLGSPGDYQESFASASHQSSRTISDFSSRGPSSTFGHDPYTKPNISAPGSSICSSVPTDGWSCGYSGTSMASPHSAGAVALLWSCNPSLIGSIDTTFELLQSTADTPPAGNCSAPPDGQGNYTYGYGYLNVLAAGTATCSGVESGTLNGFVYDSGGTPLEGASVTALTTATTDATGFYTMSIPEGTYSVTASKYGYLSETVDGVEIIANTTTTQDFSLTYEGAWMGGAAACFDWTRYDVEYFPGTGLIYALGGRSDANTNGSIYSYDPASGACVDTGVDLPTPISNYTINLVNDGTADVLCTFGGRDSAGGSTLNVQCYDPLANTASVVATLPAAYTGYTPGANAVYNNNVYIFGGFKNTAAPYELARTDRFDPVTKTFTQLGNLSQARSYLYAAVVDGKIYAFGGTVYDGTNLNAQTRAEVMADPEGAGTWSDADVLDLPTAYDEGQAIGFDADIEIPQVAGKIVFMGGGQWPGETADVWTYDVLTNTYDTSFPDLQGARRNHGAAFVPGSSDDPTDGLPALWVFGGRSGADTPPYQGVEYFPLAYPPVVHNIYLPAIMK
ncbi:MAG: S8 family serine peptidase, partial [Anaerolineaceae bacterium]